MAVSDPAAWAQEVALPREERERRQLEAARRRSPAELLAWWRESRRAMLEVLRPLDRRARIPWYGPPNSCTPAAQETFQSAVAMLHSFRYSEGPGATRPELTQARTFLAANP